MKNVLGFGIVLQIVAVVAGIWIGIQIYEWGTGASVSFF
jgi:hypothetical protein